MKRSVKIIGVMVLGAVLIYSASLILIRLRMTAMAYKFEELKERERAMEEEQLKLKALLAEKLSPAKLILEGYSEPEPDQIVVIP